MPPHSSTNLKIQRYYPNEAKFNGVYSRKNLPKIKHGAYATNIEELKSIETHFVAIYVHSAVATYFDSFGVEHIPKEIKKFVRNTVIKAIVYRMQAYDSIMRRYFCIGFTNFMLKNNRLY